MTNTEDPLVPPTDATSLHQQVEQLTEGADPYLDTVLKAVLGNRSENEDTSLPLTVLTPGGVVSGTVVSARRWSKHLRASLTTGNEAVDGAFGRLFDDIQTDYEEFVDALDAHELPYPAFSYIHFEDAVVYAGNVPLNGGNFRVERRKIGGWSFGLFKPNDG
ncbi:hypothetical protein JOE63_002801 [Cellulosimicrobium cellulans]|uniref:hypothetical protein n=1 Tax=Cellulosimicrobium cellulans TaxID=1710 RepID=UPI00195BC035|nr:hypothetical protein [Cellulosimicrobium cellulans]MBM7820324.1 hypothetical protein [Cellulosimicrobium cellulans]